MKIIIGSEGMGSYGKRIIENLIHIAYPNVLIEWKNDDSCDIIVRSHFTGYEFDNDEPVWNTTKKPYIYWSGESPTPLLDPKRHSKYMELLT